MSTLYLIRHGRTLANSEHRYCGSSDISLSPEGIAELKELCYELQNVKFFTSGMQRTNETLKELFGEVPFEILPQFREIDFGIFEMRTYAELKDDPAYIAWITGDNERNVPPGGESGEAFSARVVAAFHSLQRQEGDKVLITHGGVIAAIMAHLFPNEGKNRYQWQPEPGRGYAIIDRNYSVKP